MNSILYVGMDVHKENYTLCCYSFDRDKVEYRQTVPSDYRLILKYLEQVRRKYPEEVEFICGYLPYPAFVLCLLDEKARVFAIRSCKSNEPKGFKFSKPRGEQKGVVTISNKNLLDPLRAVTGEDWIPGKRYKVRGFWVADAKTMCFDLNEGVQEDFRPVTPSSDAE